MKLVLAAVVIGPMTLIGTPSLADAAPTNDPAVSRAPEIDEQEVEEIRILGIRTGRLTADPTAFDDVLHVEDYEAERIDLPDLLAREAGVQIRRFGGPGERSEISIRGSTSSQVPVVLDGVPMNGVLSGGVDLSQVCVGMIDTVEVSRGGGSLDQGSGAIGGVVKLASRRPGRIPVNRITVSGGAFGTWEATAHRSGMAGPIGYSAGYCGFTTDGDYRFARPVFEADVVTSYAPPVITRINNQRVRHSGALSLATDVAERGSLQLHDYITYSSHGEPGLDSGNGQLGGQNPSAHGRSSQNLFSLEGGLLNLGVLGDEFVGRFYHRYQRDNYHDEGTGEDDLRQDLLTHVNTVNLSLADHWRARLLAAEHELSFHFDTRHDSLAASDRPDAGRSTIGVMLREEARYLDERVVVVPALRFDRSEGFTGRWLPSVGIVLEPLPWFRVRGGIERSFRIPGFDELYLPDKGFVRGNPKLSAEQARNADVGVEFEVLEIGPLHDLRFSGAVFQQDIQDSIVWMTVSAFTVQPVNTGSARVRGYELAGSFSVTDYVRLTVSHTGLDARSVETGMHLPGRAASETHLRVEVGKQEAWKLVAEMQNTGAIPVSETGLRTIAARTVWHTSASLNLAEIPAFRVDRLFRKLWLFLEVNNVGDVAVRDALFFPQPGRNGHLGMEVEW